MALTHNVRVNKRSYRTPCPRVLWVLCSPLSSVFDSGSCWQFNSHQRSWAKKKKEEEKSPSSQITFSVFLYLSIHFDSLTEVWASSSVNRTSWPWAKLPQLKNARAYVLQLKRVALRWSRCPLRDGGEKRQRRKKRLRVRWRESLKRKCVFVCVHEYVGESEWEWGGERAKERERELAWDWLTWTSHLSPSIVVLLLPSSIFYSGFTAACFL